MKLNTSVGLFWIFLCTVLDRSEQAWAVLHDDATIVSRSSPQCDRTDNSSHHRYDPLACWLWSLKAAIPDQKFKKSVFTISIHDMTCTNFTMDDIGSQYIPSEATGSKDPSISVSIQGLSATCVGKYKSTGMSGTVRASVVSVGGDDKWMLPEITDDNANNVALGLNVTFVSILYQDRIRMAKSVNTSDCKAQLVVPKHDGLKFSGSMSAKFINLFSSTIASYVSSALSSQVCPALQPILEKDLTSILQQVDMYLMDKILPNRTMESHMVGAGVVMHQRWLPSHVGLDDSESYVDWKRDTPLLRTALEFTNRFLDRYLQQGFLVDLLGRFGFGSNPLEDCGCFFRGVNGLVKSLTRGTGSVQFGIPNVLSRLGNISFVLPKYAAVRVLTHNISIDGVDKLSRLNLLRPDNMEQVFKSILRSTDGFNVTINMEVQVHSIEGGMFQGDPLVESFYVVLNTSDVVLHSDVSIDYDSKGFANIAMGDVISTIDTALKNITIGVPCLVSPLRSVQFPTLAGGLHISAASFFPDGTVEAGQLESDLDRMLNTFLILFLREYDTLVAESVAGLIKGPGKYALNAYLGDAIPTLVPARQSDECQEWDEEKSDLFDFSKHRLFHKMNEFLSKPSTVGDINDYARCVSGVFNRDIGLNEHSLQVEGLDLRLQRFTLENLSTLSEIEILSPANDCVHVRNSASFGTGDLNASLSTQNGPTLSLSLDASAELFNFSGQLNLTTALSNVIFDSMTLVRYNINQLLPVKLSSILANVFCALFPVDALITDSHAWDIGDTSTNLSLLLSSSVFNNTHVSMDEDTLSMFSSLVRSVLLWMGLSITDSTNAYFSNLLPRSESMCYGTAPEREVEETVDESWHLATLGIIGSLVVVAHVVFLFLRLNSSAHTAEFGEELTCPLLEASQLTPDSHAKDTPQSEEIRAAWATSLMHNTRVPRRARHAFPIMVISTMALLASSNVSTGASVDVILTFNDYPAVEFPSVFAFSLGNTIREMYSAGVYPLLALVVVFSGIWPYMKLLLMMFAWLAQASEMSYHKRGRLLFCLDALSKFSLVDTFVLVLMMVSFRFHLGLQDMPVLDVYVDPGFGFYGFLLATTLSLLGGHVALFFHRRARMTSGSSITTAEPLVRHEFEDVTTNSRWRMSSRLQAIFIFLLGLTFAFITIGATKNSFVFDFDGLAGELIGIQRHRVYSLVTLGSSLPQSVQDSSNSGIFLLQGAYFFYALVMPLACLVSLAVVFFLPLTPQAQEWALAVAEVFNAWSAIEVFLLSILASLFQISNFVRFMIGDRCDWINSVLQNSFNDALQGDDTCYMVKSSVESNVWYLALGVVLYSVIVSTLLRFAHCAMEERHLRDSTCKKSNQGDLLAHHDQDRTFVHMLLQSGLVRLLFFVNCDGEQHPLSPCDSQFWVEWRRVSSFT